MPSACGGGGLLLVLTWSVQTSVGGETIAQTVEFDVEEQTKNMAKDLVAASVAIDEKIDSLPHLEPVNVEKQRRIVELWEQHNQLDEAVRRESDELQHVLAELQEVWAPITSMIDS